MAWLSSTRSGARSLSKPNPTRNRLYRSIFLFGRWAFLRPSSRKYLMAKPNTPKLERPPRRYKGKTDDIVEEKRLQDLRKQKAPIEGQLQWIDSEIASLQTAATAPIRAHQSSSNRRGFSNLRRQQILSLCQRFPRNRV